MSGCLKQDKVPGNEGFFHTLNLTKAFSPGTPTFRLFDCPPFPSLDVALFGLVSDVYFKLA